ncbi:MAG: PAS domain S-box protein, partial [bacterium]|nr:PAS domain S-box protein [bacterium]
MGKITKKSERDLSKSPVHSDQSSHPPHQQRETRVTPSPHGILVSPEELCSALFDMSADGIIQCDLTGIITDANPAFCRMTGYAREDLTGRNYRDITHPDWLEPEQLSINKAIAEKCEYACYEKSYLTSSNQELPVSLTSWVARTGQGKAVGYIAFVRDITETRQKEFSLRQDRILVEGEVQRRTAELEN